MVGARAEVPKKSLWNSSGLTDRHFDASRQLHTRNAALGGIALATRSGRADALCQAFVKLEGAVDIADNDHLLVNKLGKS